MSRAAPDETKTKDFFWKRHLLHGTLPGPLLDPVIVQLIPFQTNVLLGGGRNTSDGGGGQSGVRTKR